MQFTRTTIFALLLTVGLAVAPIAYHYSQGNLTAAPLPPQAQTDAVMVFTGSSDRISKGYQFFLLGFAKKIMITGYDYPRYVQEPKARRLSDVSKKNISKDRVYIDLEAKNTIENAKNGADWAIKNHVKSILLVTTEAHMPRAYFELRRLLPDNVKVYTNAVPGKLKYRGLDSEKGRLICRLYETATGTSFCYTARNALRSLGL